MPGFLRILLAGAMLLGAASAQEIPLQHCDRLPLIEVQVGARSLKLLVDTAATSTLNLKSFPDARPRQDLEVTSWSGTAAAGAREVSLPELRVGELRLTGLKLPAIDLSAIGRACGKPIDGILGVDLLARLGATIDLNRQTLRFADAASRDAHQAESQKEQSGQLIVAEMHHDMHACMEALNSGDEARFAFCLDPNVVLFTPEAAIIGRERVKAYLHEKYFLRGRFRIALREETTRAIDDAVSYEYEVTLDSPSGALHARGMGICRKAEGQWRVASLVSRPQEK
jgi:hypothetical protein